MAKKLRLLVTRLLLLIGLGLADLPGVKPGIPGDSSRPPETGSGGSGGLGCGTFVIIVILIFVVLAIARELGMMDAF